MIDETNFPYFEDSYLEALMTDEPNLKVLARELCLIKAGIQEFKLGDVTIPAPEKHFLRLARQYRTNMTGSKVRADGT